MNKDDDFSLGEIRQISVNVHDLERAVAFYKDRLRLRHLFTVPPKMAFFDAGGIRLMLAIAERPEFDHPSSILYFKVQEIERAHAVLQARGVEFQSGPTLIARACWFDLRALPGARPARESAHLSRKRIEQPPAGRRGVAQPHIEVRDALNGGRVLRKLRCCARREI